MKLYKPHNYMRTLGIGYENPSEVKAGHDLKLVLNKPEAKLMFKFLMTLRKFGWVEGCVMNPHPLSKKKPRYYAEVR